MTWAVFNDLLKFMHLFYVILIMLIYRHHFFNYLDIKGDEQEQCDLIKNEASKKYLVADYVYFVIRLSL